MFDDHEQSLWKARLGLRKHGSYLGPIVNGIHHIGYRSHNARSYSLIGLAAHLASKNVADMPI